MYTNAAFLDTSLDTSWKEIQRSSIELFDDKHILGKFGIPIVRGSLSFPLESRKMDCSIKTLESKFSFFNLLLLFLDSFFFHFVTNPKISLMYAKPAAF